MALKCYDAFLSSLRKVMLGDEHELKSKIIKRLVHKIDLGSDKVTLHFKMDQNSLVGEPMDLGPRLRWNGKLGVVERLEGGSSGKPQNDGGLPLDEGLFTVEGGKVGFYREKGTKKGDLQKVASCAKRASSHTLTFGAPERT